MTMEKPILFSGPMVRAILDGRKTQTRRTLKVERIPHKVKDPNPLYPDHQWIAEVQGGRWGFGAFGATEEQCLQQLLEFGGCHYGHRGTRLWVRETTAIVDVRGNKAWLARAERMPPGKKLSDTDGGLEEFSLETEEAVEQAKKLKDDERFRPSIHMPRWASRILLEITDVRVQRVKDISEEDAKAEGVDGLFDTSLVINSTEAFSCLWDSINEARGFGWVKNPLVWALTFKRVG